MRWSDLLSGLRTWSSNPLPCRAEKVADPKPGRLSGPRLRFCLFGYIVNCPLVDLCCVIYLFEPCRGRKRVWKAKYITGRLKMPVRNWGRVVASPGLAMSWKNRKSMHKNPRMSVKLSIFFTSIHYHNRKNKKEPVTHRKKRRGRGSVETAAPSV